MARGKYWSKKEEDKLLNMLTEGYSVEFIAEYLKRKPSGIEARIRVLNRKLKSNPNIELPFDPIPETKPVKVTAPVAKPKTVWFDKNGVVDNKEKSTKEKSRKWTDLEDATLLSMSGKVTDFKKVSKVLNRTPKACQLRLSLLRKINKTNNNMVVINNDTSTVDEHKVDNPTIENITFIVGVGLILSLLVNAITLWSIL